MLNDPKKRFSNRVSDYTRYRPGYPAAIIAHLEEHAGLQKGEPVADVGAGTGIFTALLLELGYPVYSVEPNAEMRAAAVAQLGGQPGFTMVDASAEDTGLPDASVQAVTAAQAFHWFDHSLARPEFKRILKPGGILVLVWNSRDDADSFTREYERIIKSLSIDYTKTTHTQISNEDTLAEFYAPEKVNLQTFENQQIFDLEGLIGRTLSSSYAPLEGHPKHASLLAALEEHFAAHQQNGKIILRYVTELYWGKL